MTVLASEIITRSYYLANVCAADLETPSASQMTTGLMLLNEILNLKRSDLQLIPYYTNQFEFTCVVGQEDYTISNLLLLEVMNFNFQTVRYPMKEMSRDEYFGLPRANNIRSLPISYYSQPVKGGSQIFLYFLPDQEYVMQLSGKFALLDVTEDTDLSLTYDGDYIAYLKYELAQFICNENCINLPIQTTAKLEEIKQKFIYKSVPDLKIQKSSTFDRGSNLTWAQLNIGGAWTRGQ